MSLIRYKKKNKALHIGTEYNKISCFFPTEWGRKFSVRFTINGNSWSYGW